MRTDPQIPTHPLIQVLALLALTLLFLQMAALQIWALMHLVLRLTELWMMDLLRKTRALF